MTTDINHIDYIYTDRNGREHTARVKYEHINTFLSHCQKYDFSIIGQDGAYYSTLEEQVSEASVD